MRVHGITSKTSIIFLGMIHYDTDMMTDSIAIKQLHTVIAINNFFLHLRSKSITYIF